ncbi:DUF4056 domain-containing protein [Escherichia sp. E4742]|uniref:DUF4056 domain-containing protein n=1 Tax=Escherichia sp. E4742 TaxID=2044467 RepID=UPI001080742F|nr:DUF4056 domain-containing protein [Escherichia sp. E4742]QCT87618.1 DUF4056 domain-containing protein [Escherichia sp. E4742]TGB53934.1 hypothetical protein CRI69_25025 [Escherichia sp. E4742]TLJ06849.1 DUF4056 domain-containing protein [Escherichia sp. E4742]
MLCLVVSTTLPVQAAIPLLLWPDRGTENGAVWPVMSPLPAPEGLRACCALGYDMRVRIPGMAAALPFYQVDNIVSAGTTGGHHYNDSLLPVSINGGAAEYNGIVWTAKGGFVDTAHVRDTADMTVWIFTNLWPRLGDAFSLNPGREELVQRRLVFRAFTPPSSPRERYILAAGMAARLAWQLAAWHEIAQWYGFESVPGFSEEVSAFSPEDLWSNMLGARIAESLILSGHVSGRRMYEVAMGQALRQVLTQLGAATHAGTRARLRQLDGLWWDSRRVLPDKWLLRRRNYDMADVRCPTPVPGGDASVLCLTLPLSAGTMPAALQLWPGQKMRRLPATTGFYSVADFSRLAAMAERADMLQAVNR